MVLQVWLAEPFLVWIKVFMNCKVAGAFVTKAVSFQGLYSSESFVFQKEHNEVFLE